MPKERRFTVTLPGDLHARLKIKCAADDVRMGDFVRRFVERECADISIATPQGKPAKKSAKICQGR
jgi:hypothetical protein